MKIAVPSTRPDLTGTLESLTEKVEGNEDVETSRLKSILGACAMVKDLQAAYDVHANKGEFGQKLNEFMQAHTKRRQLVERLVKAGVWKEDPTV